MNTVHLTQKKKIIFWGYLPLLTLFFIGMLAMAASAWTPMQNFAQSDNFYYANQVAFEWTKGTSD